MEFDLKDFGIEEQEQSSQNEFSISDFGVEEPKTQEELVVEQDEIYSKKMEQLKLNLEDKNKKIEKLIEDED